MPRDPSDAKLNLPWISRLAGPYLAPLADRFISYALAGAVATAADFAVLTSLVEGLGMHLFPWYLVAATLGFAVGATVSFTLSYRWVFADRRGVIHRQLAKYLTVAAIGVVLNGLILTFAVETLGWWYVWGKAVATAVVLFYNFTFNSLWSFQKGVAFSSGLGEGRLE